MRHGVAYRKLGRTTSHRLALFRNMVTALILRDRIITTVPKAKELRRWAEWMVTLGKTGTLAARRHAAATVRDSGALTKLFSILAERYRDRAGGYTRIVRLGERHGDAAPMAVIEYIAAEAQGGQKAAKAKIEKAKGKKAPPAPKKTKAAK